MKDLDYNLIARHLAGETSWSEELQIKHWRQSNADAESTYQQLKELWQNNYAMMPAPNKDKVRQMIEEATQPAERRIYSYLSIAASVILLIGVAFFFWAQTSEPSTVWQNKTTVAGQKSTLTLSDGSTIYLNAQSSLKYPEKFAGDTRSVKLSGEAFFAVKPGKKPFVVQTDSISVTVLGTSFNISAYRQQPAVQVAVATGKVKVSSNVEDLLLIPNDMATYSKSTRLLSKSPVDIEKKIAWKDGWLIFDDTPLSEVAKTLTQWYGMEVKLASGNLNQCLFTGKFKNETLRNVLDNICFTSKLKYTVTENQFIIEGKGCND